VSSTMRSLRQAGAWRSRLSNTRSASGLVSGDCVLITPHLTTPPRAASRLGVTPSSAHYLVRSPRGPTGKNSWASPRPPRHPHHQGVEMWRGIFRAQGGVIAAAHHDPAAPTKVGGDLIRPRRERRHSQCKSRPSSGDTSRPARYSITAFSHPRSPHPPAPRFWGRARPGAHRA
jgi:hypothetical protein